MLDVLTRLVAGAVVLILYENGQSQWLSKLLVTLTETTHGFGTPSGRIGRHAYGNTPACKPNDVRITP